MGMESRWPKPSETPVATLPETEQPIVWVSHDGSRALEGGTSRMLRLHQLREGSIEAELGPLEDWVCTADVTRDGSIAVSAGGGKFFERTVEIHHSEAFLKEWNEAREGEYWPLASSRTEQVFEPRDHRLWIWDLKARACTTWLDGPAEKVLLARISGKGSLVLALDDRRTIYGFQLPDGRALGQWKAPTRASCFAFLGEEGLVLVGSESGRLYRLGMLQNHIKEIKPREPTFDAIRGLVASPCGRFAVATTQFGLELLDIAQNASRGVLYRKNLWVHDVVLEGREVSLLVSEGRRLFRFRCAAVG